MANNNWDESKHPRDDEGKFTFKGQGTTNPNDGNAVWERRANIFYPDMEDKKKLESKVLPLSSSLENINNTKIVGEKDYIKSDNSSDWIMPIEGGYISSPYGNRKSPGDGASTFHSGIDIAVPVGTPVKAIADGKVKIASGGIKGYGNAVYIDHGNLNGKRIESEYGHVSEFCVKPGQKVKKGQIIAFSGGEKGAPGSGVSQGPHLHLTIREYDNTTLKGKSVSPDKYISIKN